MSKEAGKTAVVDLNAFAQQAADEEAAAEAAEQQRREDEFQAELQRATGPIVLTIRRMVEQGDLEGLRALADRISPAYGERMRELMSQVHDLREESGGLQRELRATSQTISRLQDELQAAKAEVRTRDDQIRNKNSQIENLNQQVRELGGQVEELQSATRDLPAPRHVPDPDRPTWRERLGFEPR